MKLPYQTYEQLGNRVPRYLADEFGIDSMSATAAEDYIRLAKLEPVPVPTKQQASYPGDRMTWYVDPKRTQAFKLLITAGTADKLLPKKNKQVPKYVNNKLKEAVDMLPPKVKLEADEIRVYIKTEGGQIMWVCTAENEENTVREIMESYETIWQNTINSGYVSADPIINNWQGSTTLVESVETPGEFDIFHL